MKSCVWCGALTNKEMYLRKYVIGQIGPFCSTRCENQFQQSEELKESKKQEKISEKKSTKHERELFDMEYSMLKADVEREEKREKRKRRDKEEKELKEKERLKKIRVAELQEQNRPVQAALLKYSDGLLAAVIFYFMGTFMVSLFIQPDPSNDGPAGWVWIVSGIIFVGIAGFILKKFAKEYFRKEEAEEKIKVKA